jgi:hypothetical protein
VPSPSRQIACYTEQAARCTAAALVTALTEIKQDYLILSKRQLIPEAAARADLRLIRRAWNISGNNPVFRFADFECAKTAEVLWRTPQRRAHVRTEGPPLFLCTVASTGAHTYRASTVRPFFSGCRGARPHRLNKSPRGLARRSGKTAIALSVSGSQWRAGKTSSFPHAGIYSNPARGPGNSQSMGRRSNERSTKQY